MPNPRQGSQSEQPLYVRWTPDVCPYALEMRMDLITRLKQELQQSDALGIEIGGVFVGVFPTPASPTLRLDDYVLVPRNVVEGNVIGGAQFSLGPAQVERLAAMAADARHTVRPAVGFFRSHLRAAAMAPSKADIDMLSQQFPEGLFAFLMITGAPNPDSQREGAFYLAISGVLPETPSSPPFPFDETAFKSLSELPAEATEDVRNFNFGPAIPKRHTPWAAVISLALLLFLIGTWTLGSRISQLFRPDSNQIDLNVVAAGMSLKITWDHSTPVISKAAGATMIIEDGRIQRQLKLDTDELRLGQVAYEHLSKKVSVLMSIDAPGKKLPTQTFDWNGH